MGNVENGADLIERQSKRAVKEDVLRAQQLLLTVMAIAVFADACGDKKADLVIMVKRPHRDAGKPRQFTDGSFSHHTRLRRTGGTIPHAA